MNLERQRQIIKEKHGLDLVKVEDAGVSKVQGRGFIAWAPASCPDCIGVRFPEHPEELWTDYFRNFVAAVTYAKAELARLAAAEENR